MSLFDEIQEIRKENISVGFLADECRDRFRLRSINEGVGREKLITDRNLHRPQLALAGYTKLFTYHRVQVLGNTEIYYLNSLKPEKQQQTFRAILNFDVPCLIITNSNQLDPALIEIATERGVALFSTDHETTKAVYFLSDFLDDQFAGYAPVHGSFVDVYGVGLLFVGRSGIGKSEIVLDLVERGHRLVADDVITVTRKGAGILMGAGTRIGEHFMEVRGLGILNVREMFGIRAIRFQKRVEVVVELQEWDPKAEYTRTGLDEEPVSLLDVELPHVLLPIFSGKNITVIAEVIALNYLLCHYGYNAAEVFAEKLSDSIDRSNGRDSRDRSIPYFEHDFE
ncbi:MAG: HPr kinase/phosphorylase [Chlorobi bacterium]|nr:HPr kinase/phosphorylase [Chlorobiota bacterium]